MILAGIHPVAEALRAGRPLERILVAKGAGGPRLQQIIDLARQGSVPLRFEPRQALDRLAGSAAHQGVVALGAAQKYRSLDDVAESARLLVFLDGVEDPHNLGAVIRTAHAAGADAVVIPERRAAAGALEHLPIVRVGNLNRALDEIKARGFWIYGVDASGAQDYDQVQYASPAALVLGGEGKGMHEMVRKRCHAVVRIPMAGKISSLNVSVAAGIVLFDWRRRKERSQ
jgi:23S rRNA (guanosine2251-2'-O)-methyltransferase